jgi:hypothetical protein
MCYIGTMAEKKVLTSIILSFGVLDIKRVTKN